MTEQEFMNKWEDKIMALICRVYLDRETTNCWKNMKDIRNEFMTDARACYREGHSPPQPKVIKNE